jgi:hypothetical protein
LVPSKSLGKPLNLPWVLHSLVFKVSELIFTTLGNTTESPARKIGKAAQFFHMNEAEKQGESAHTDFIIT